MWQLCAGQTPGTAAGQPVPKQNPTEASSHQAWDCHFKLQIIVKVTEPACAGQQQLQRDFIPREDNKMRQRASSPRGRAQPCWMPLAYYWLLMQKGLTLKPPGSADFKRTVAPPLSGAISALQAPQEAVGPTCVWRSHPLLYFTLVHNCFDPCKLTSTCALKLIYVFPVPRSTCPGSHAVSHCAHAHMFGASRVTDVHQICSAAAISPARLSTSKGACPCTAATVRGQESLIQKWRKASGVPLHCMKRRQDSCGNTPCVTYALTASAPCAAHAYFRSREVPQRMHGKPCQHAASSPAHAKAMLLPCVAPHGVLHCFISCYSAPRRLGRTHCLGITNHHVPVSPVASSRCTSGRRHDDLQLAGGQQAAWLQRAPGFSAGAGTPPGFHRSARGRPR